MEKDLSESHDLAAQQAELVKRMLKAYDEWWRQVRPSMIHNKR
jgi:hypothetical protein